MKTIGMGAAKPTDKQLALERENAALRAENKALHEEVEALQADKKPNQK